MRPAPRVRSFLALAAVLAVAAAACSGSASAGWTFAPVPSVSLPPATTNPSAAPGESPLPSRPVPGSPAASGSPGPSGSESTGETVRIAAQNLAFDTDELQAPAGSGFVIEFENRDAGIPHNVAIRDAANEDVFTGEIFNGPGARTYQVPALEAGTYTFVCTVHPNMTGTLTAA